MISLWDIKELFVNQHLNCKTIYTIIRYGLYQMENFIFHEQMIFISTDWKTGCFYLKINFFINQMYKIKLIFWQSFWCLDVDFRNVSRFSRSRMKFAFCISLLFKRSNQISLRAHPVLKNLSIIYSDSNGRPRVSMRCLNFFY